MVIAAVFTAISLTSCGEDDIVTPEPDIEKPVAQTIFSSGDGATRTSIKNNANFFWEKGDKIWVDKNGTYIQSLKSNITGTQPQAKFVVDASFTGDSYNVLYTGYTNSDTTTTSATKVTIANVQTQSAWSNGQHLGTSGDCATGIAYKQTDAPGYKFTLDHQASYLLLYPYLDSSLSGNYTLKSVTIYTENTPLAGEYDFTHDHGLYDSNGQPKVPLSGTASQSITLKCGTSGFLLNRTVPVPTSTTTTYNHLFVVIAPGSRNITITYTVETSTGETITFVKDIADKTYEANGVYPFIHNLKDKEEILAEIFMENLLYRWGMTTDVDVSGMTYNTTTEQVTDGFWADVPNYNAMTWYIKQGDIYWDNAALYKTWQRDMSSFAISRGGWWIKKKAYISGLSTETPYSTNTQIAETGSAIAGRPAETELSKYSFIPAMSNNLTQTRIWLSTPHDTTKAYMVLFGRYTIQILIASKGNYGGFTYPGGLNVDGSPWFQ